MSPQDSFEASTDSLDSSPRARITHIGVQADPQDVPGLERMGQHEQLGFRIDGCAYRAARQPRVTDLARIRSGAPMQWVSRLPGPAFDVEEPG